MDWRDYYSRADAGTSPLRQLRGIGVIPEWLRHFDLRMVDRLHSFTSMLWEHGVLRVNVTKGWKPLVYDKEDKSYLQHGLYYSLKKLAQDTGSSTDNIDEALKKTGTEKTWLAELLNVQSPLRSNLTIGAHSSAFSNRMPHAC